MKITKKEALHLLHLVEDGKTEDVDLYLESLVLPGGRLILGKVEQILNDIKSDVSDVRASIDSELASTAAFRCQDTMDQLVYIVEEGKNAAISTLDIAEKVKKGVELLKSGSGDIESICDEINSLLIDLMVLQGFQDLSEQVVVKIKNFIGNLEVNLAQIVDLSLAKDMELEMGPLVTGREEVFGVSDQELIDELINGVKGAG